MKPIFTHLEITRLAYSETSQNQNSTSYIGKSAEEYILLKKMQQKVDACLMEPSEQSLSKIFAVLYS